MTGTPAACVRRWTARCSRCRTYQVGLTAPPFHPWCRCCTAPYFEDMEGLGERWTRNPDGTTTKVPANTTFAQWRQSFVQGPTPGLQVALWEWYNGRKGNHAFPECCAGLARIPQRLHGRPGSNTMRPAIRRPRLSLSAMSSPAPLWMGLSPARRILTAASKRSK